MSDAAALVWRSDHGSHHVGVDDGAQGLAQLVGAAFPALDLDLSPGSLERGPLDRFGGTGSDW